MVWFRGYAMKLVKDGKEKKMRQEYFRSNKLHERINSDACVCVNEHIELTFPKEISERFDLFPFRLNGRWFWSELCGFSTFYAFKGFLIDSNTFLNSLILYINWCKVNESTEDFQAKSIEYQNFPPTNSVRFRLIHLLFILSRVWLWNSFIDKSEKKGQPFIGPPLTS